jgi:tetratricopeptide (TPR) repeat protein/DNA-binding CsgD family transcriptional regulator
MNRLVILLFLGLFLAACSSTDRELKRAEKVMPTNPDSALLILKQLQPDKHMSSSTRALYALLMSQALDKNNIRAESDSLIRIATKYYSDDEPLRAAYAQLYLARCENNLGNSREQALALLKAQEFAAKCEDPKLQGLIYGDKADMYQSQGQTDSMILYNRLCFYSFQKANDARNSVLALITMGNGYLHKSEFDSAIRFYHEADKMAKPMKESVLSSTIYRALGGAMFKQQKYAEALYYFRQTPLTETDRYNYNKWYLMAMTFLRMNRLDSAKVYLCKVKNPYEMASDYYRLWEELYEKQGKLSESLYYAKRLVDVKDSLQQRTLASSFAGMEKKYKYEHLLVDNKNLVIENKQNGIVLLFSLLILSVIIIIFLVWRFKANKNQLLIQKQIIDQRNSLIAAERENNSLMNQQMQMQHLLLKNVEQYRKRVIKGADVSGAETENSKNNVQTNAFHEELISHVDLIHSNISKRLSECYPILTQRDILVCCLILADFDSGMISTILDVKPDSVNVHRGRLRKKLELQNPESLQNFLRSF